MALAIEQIDFAASAVTSTVVPTVEGRAHLATRPDPSAPQEAKRVLLSEPEQEWVRRELLRSLALQPGFMI